MGELLPWSKLPVIGLLWSIPYEREAVDDRGETSSYRMLVLGVKRREWRLTVLYIAAVTPAQVQQHMGALLSNLEIRMLVAGNLYKDEAIALAKVTEEILPSSPLPGIGPVDLSLELPEGASRSSRIRSSDSP